MKNQDLSQRASLLLQVGFYDDVLVIDKNKYFSAQCFKAGGPLYFILNMFISSLSSNSLIIYV